MICSGSKVRVFPPFFISCDVLSRKLNHSVTTNPLIDVLYHSTHVPPKDPDGVASRSLDADGDDAAVLAYSSDTTPFPGFMARHVRSSETFSSFTLCTSSSCVLDFLSIGVGLHERPRLFFASN